MAVTAFDPYHKWLGIPPEEQPPNHYRLLGVRLFETDRDVISHAADQRMIHLRSFQAGKNGKLSQQLLNELAAARVCLLKGDKKAEYDAELRAKMAANLGGAAAIAAPPPPSPADFLTAAPPPPEEFSPTSFGQAPPPAGPLAALDLMPVPASASPLTPAGSMFDHDDHGDEPPAGTIDQVMSATPSFRAKSTRGVGGRRSNNASLATTIAIVSIVVLALAAGLIAFVINSSSDNPDDNSSAPPPVAPEPRREPHKALDQKTPRPELPARAKPSDTKRPSPNRGPLDPSGKGGTTPPQGKPAENSQPAASPAAPNDNDDSPGQFDLKSQP